MRENRLGALPHAVPVVENRRRPLDGRRMYLVFLLLRERSGLREEVALCRIPRIERVEQRSVAVENEAFCILKTAHGNPLESRVVLQ